MKVNPFTMLQLARVCLEEGMPPWPSVTCVAVGWAESGGNAYAVGINDYDPTLVSYLSLDLGVWQTNTHWHPEVSIAEALDPTRQIIHVDRIARRNAWLFDWSAWNTYKTNAHVKFLPLARVAVRDAGGAV